MDGSVFQAHWRGGNLVLSFFCFVFQLPIVLAVAAVFFARALAVRLDNTRCILS